MRIATTRCGSSVYRRALKTLCDEGLSERTLVIASNRGPVEYRQSEGRILARRGQGGLVTALSSLVEVVESDWVAAPLSKDDAEVALRSNGEVTVEIAGNPLRVSFIHPLAEDYRAYYDRISNSLLWFLQHGIHNTPEDPDFDERMWEDWESYSRVNRLFAEEIRKKCRHDPRPVVMIHDYHLYLVPGMVRRMLPHALVHHFTHIAWPSPELWRQLPGRLRTQILESLLSCDIVGFHTPRYVDNFVQACREFLGVQGSSGVIHYKGHTTLVRAYPISIDPEGLELFAASEEVRTHEEQFNREGFNILQVARTDPSKNILRSLKALELLLERHPKYRKRLTFWGLLPASRQNTPVYKQYLEAIKQKSEEINHRYEDWHPVELFLDNSYARAIAAMKHYDVLLVNSLADGMNLVAKEGPIVNTRDGVLLLSEGTGAWEELAPPASIALNPFDIVGTEEAMDRALSLSPHSRAFMRRLLCERIEETPIFRWAYEQIRDLLEIEHGEQAAA